MADVAAPIGGAESSPDTQPPLRKRVQGWVRGREEQVEEARRTSTTVGFAFDAFSYDTDTGAPVLAAALGFRVFLFQVPWACLFVIMAGFFSDVTGREVTSLFNGRGILRLTALAVSSASELSGWARFTGLVIVAYALFLSARSLVKVMNIVHALVWDVPRKKVRTANRAALLFIGLVSLLIALSIGITIVRGESSVGGFTLLILYTVAPFSAWWWVSWRLPHRDCPLIALAPGAVLFAVGVEVLHVVTVIWFPHTIEYKSELYGAIGVALTLLLWAYLLGRVITLAAVLNSTLWRRFGADSAHPAYLRRPSWHVPLIDDRLGRIWVAVFGDEGGGATGGASDDGTESP